MEEDGIGGKGDTEREFGSGIRVGSAVVVVEVLVPIEVRELQDERLEREPMDKEVDIGGDDIVSLTFIALVLCFSPSFSFLFFSFSFSLSFLSLCFSRSRSFRASFSRSRCANTLCAGVSFT